jgi:hypothetical protein
MLKFKQYLLAEQELLTEADTSKATNAEMAICVAYNMIHNTDEGAMGYVYSKEMNEAEQKNFDLAVARAGVGGKEGKFKGLMDIGYNVAKISSQSDAGKWGDGNDGANGDTGGNILVHAGASSSESTQYAKPASDNTSKADIRGNKSYQISLKKGGAQLMSAKSGEAEGIFTAALKHYGKPKTKLFEDALKVLHTEMEKASKSGKDALIRTGASKEEFVDWYTTASKRFKALNKLKIDWPNKVPGKRKGTSKSGLATDLKTHLKAELTMVNIPQRPRNFDNLLNKLHPDIKPRLFEYKGRGGLGKKDLETLAKLETEFEESGWAIGKTGNRSKEDIVISQRHLKKQNMKAADIVDSDIKKQITDVIHKSATSIEWKNTLEEAFKSDTEFSKWVVYEGASGYYKFTGESKAGSWSKYKGDKKSVANRMVIFEDSGVTTDVDMIKYAQDHPELVTSLDISYKASGANRYIKFGVPSVVNDTINESYESELPMLQEELTRLDAQYMLNEGVFSMFASAKQKLIAFKDKIKNILVNFWENVIKRFIGKLGEWLKEGIDVFMENLGFKGEVTFGTV